MRRTDRSLATQNQVQRQWQMLDGEETQQSQKDCIVDLGAELQLGQEVKLLECHHSSLSSRVVHAAGILVFLVDFHAQSPRLPMLCVIVPSDNLEGYH